MSKDHERSTSYKRRNWQYAAYDLWLTIYVHMATKPFKTGGTSPLGPSQVGKLAGCLKHTFSLGLMCFGGQPQKGPEVQWNDPRSPPQGVALMSPLPKVKTWRTFKWNLTLPESNVSPGNWWLGDYLFPFGCPPIFREYVSFREGNIPEAGFNHE